jgi:hypothetical protein
MGRKLPADLDWANGSFSRHCTESSHSAIGQYLIFGLVA